MEKIRRKFTFFASPSINRSNTAYLAERRDRRSDIIVTQANKKEQTVRLPFFAIRLMKNIWLETTIHKP